MTDKKKIDVGQSIAYSTRPAGLNTYLLLEIYADENGVSSAAEATWHIELCCQNDHPVIIDDEHASYKIDVSAAAGALMTVRNTSNWPFYCWTDY